MTMIKSVQTFLARNLGWKIQLDEATFEARLTRVCKELGHLELHSFVRSLEEYAGDMRVLQAFAREYSVGESYFFRDNRSFDYFKSVLIPEIIKNSEHSLSIWSVGCSSGEELYSIAILLRELILDIDNRDLYLLGTDIDPKAIQKAKRGEYTQFSLRQTPQHYKSYFKAHDGIFEIDSKIKKMVQFKSHNIMDGPYSCLPSLSRKFDLILVKNVLIYFDDQKAKTVVDSLFSALNEKGYLATTPAEYSEELFNVAGSLRLENEYVIQKLSLPEEGSSTLFIEPKTSEPQIIDTLIEELLESKLQSEVADPRPKTDDTPSTYYHNALKRLKDDDPKEAKVLLRQALYLDDDLVMAHVVLANILKKEGRSRSAMRHIENAKERLSKMLSEETVALSDGIMASDLFTMVDAIKEESLE